MADVSKLTINNDEYDLKDAVARADIATAQDDIAQAQDDITTLEGNVETLEDTKVSKSGDTMTGSLVISGGANYKGLEIVGAVDSPYIHFYNTGTRLTIDQYANGSAGGERFLMPTPEARSGDAWYSILTNKTPVTTAQGGTGGTDSGWQSYTNSSVFTGTIYYRKIGTFAIITFSGLTLNSQTSSGTIDLGTLTYATGMTPTHLMTFPARVYNSGTEKFVTLMSIYPTGSNGTRIRMYNLEGSPTLPTTATLHATAFYVI